MKIKLAWLLLIILLASCEKDQCNDHTCFVGEWQGTLTQMPSGEVESPYSCATHRSITGTTTLTSVWWTEPDVKCELLFNCQVYSFEAIITDQTNSPQHWSYVYEGTGQMKGDTLIEKGTLKYRYTQDGIKRVAYKGTFIAKLTKVR